MKNILLIVWAVLLSVGPASAKRYYVTPTGTGAGSTWQDALGHLQKALAVAVAGDEVWVARGTYRPTQTPDRKVSFRIPSGVAVYGGFQGTETQLAERNWQINTTTLSGDLGVPGDSTDNSNTIVYFDRVSNSTILDGFFIVGGTAKGFVRGADPKAAGAAIFNNGAGGVSSPRIRNCIFRDNSAREGAAIYNYASGGKCEPLITNCKFLNNAADFNGGAIFNDGSKGVCNPKIIGCDFANNRAVYGASILNQAEYGVCKPLIEKSVFMDNATAMSGSVVYNKLGTKSQVYAIIVACQLKDNYSAVGSHVENNSERNLSSTSGSPTGGKR